MIFAVVPAAKAQSKQNSRISRNEVRQMQRALKQAGFDPGPVDGVMGPLTITTIRNYQSHFGLNVTGTLTAETRDALMGTGTARSTTPNSSTYNSVETAQLDVADTEQTEAEQTPVPADDNTGDPDVDPR
jgi:peptidoglycan hydrolase-like protein with peptidoglycan-binding domain